MSRELSLSNFLQCDERPRTYVLPIKEANSITLLGLSSSGVPVRPKIDFRCTKGRSRGSLVIIPNSSRPARRFLSLNTAPSLCVLFDSSISSFVQQSDSFRAKRLFLLLLDLIPILHPELTPSWPHLHESRLQ